MKSNKEKILEELKKFSRHGWSSWAIARRSNVDHVTILALLKGSSNEMSPLTMKKLMKFLEKYDYRDDPEESVSIKKNFYPEKYERMMKVTQERRKELLEILDLIKNFIPTKYYYFHREQVENFPVISSSFYHSLILKFDFLFKIAFVRKNRPFQPLPDFETIPHWIESWEQYREEKTGR